MHSELARDRAFGAELSGSPGIVPRSRSQTEGQMTRLKLVTVGTTTLR